MAGVSMTITTGVNNTGTSQVSGPIESFVPPEIIAIFQRLPGGGYRYWVKGETDNNLTDLVAGEDYDILSSSTITTDVFTTSGAAVTPKFIRYSFYVESVNNVQGFTPFIILPNKSMSLLRVSAVGNDATDSVRLIGELVAGVRSSAVGSVAVTEDSILIASTNFANSWSTGTGKIAVGVINNIPAFTGVTKWAVSVEVTQILF